jgi:hypothetical protein
VGERLDGDAMAHRQEETPEVLNAHVVLIWIATACRLGDSSTLSEEEERGRWYDTYKTVLGHKYYARE